MKKDLTYCQTRHHEIMVELDQMDELKERENRAFTQEEGEKYEARMREDNRLNGIMESRLTGQKLEEHREKKERGKRFGDTFHIRYPFVVYSRIMLRSVASSMTVTPSVCALVSLEPAASPATT